MPAVVAFETPLPLGWEEGGLIAYIRTLRWGVCFEKVSQ